MNLHPALRTAVILVVLFTIVYALADGIRYGSILGVLLAAGSMAALFVCIHLATKLSQAPDDEEQA